ncbi:MAG: hypothetical protein AAGC64_05515 [Bacteroidota bacterium]
MKYALVLFIFLLGFFSFAQKKERPVRDYLPTENLKARKDANNVSNRPKRKKIELIYVKSARGILYGNACAIQETHRMGFEYIVEPVNGMESRSWFGKLCSNLWVKTKLFFRRSPFWKATLNKRIKRCRRQTGDFVG